MPFLIIQRSLKSFFDMIWAIYKEKEFQILAQENT